MPLPPLTCALVDDEPLALSLLAGYVERLPQLRLSATYSSAVQALLNLQSEPVDLIFLDIQMPGLSGLDMSRRLPDTTRVVFTTAFSDYAVESYRVNALDYLLKPISFEDFSAAVQKAVAWKTAQGRVGTPAPEADSDCLFVKSGRRQMRIDLSHLLYAEAQKDYVRLVTDDDQSLLVLMPLKRLIDRLPADRFVQIHRSFVVNMAHVSEIDSGNVVFGRTRIPIGNIYRDHFESLLRHL